MNFFWVAGKCITANMTFEVNFLKQKPQQKFKHTQTQVSGPKFWESPFWSNNFSARDPFSVAIFAERLFNFIHINLTLSLENIDNFHFPNCKFKWSTILPAGVEKAKTSKWLFKFCNELSEQRQKFSPRQSTYFLRYCTGKLSSF